MKRISLSFADDKRKTLIAYVTVGYPDIDTTLQIVPILEHCGVDIVELGIPFSDPMADGATIQRASFQALSNGVNPQICLDIARQLRQRVNLPLFFMTYYNPLLAYGMIKFCHDCVVGGIDGLIVPDLIPDEGRELEEITKGTGLDLVYLLAPTSPDARIKLIARRSRGFIYLVSVAGVTGDRSEFPTHLSNIVRQIKKISTSPVYIGFGISTPEQAKKAAEIADGVIIGSRILQLLDSDQSLLNVQDFMREVRNSINSITRN